ncbi:MAG TPA: tetratricopeptide repeat protein [Gemmatimonadaceae bacterium]|nr:tetratricopeptide repeat protein [Gemmatimonadaceae bacterium]
MKALQRPMVVGLGLAMMAAVPSLAQAQYGYSRPTGPTADTPHLLVGTCHSTPRQLGVDASKALRDRITNENNPRDLYVIPNKDVNGALTASGYAPDSALSVGDLGALGKLVHADEIVDCDASQTPNGVRLAARMLLASDVTKAQPYPPVDAKNWDDAAAAMERENTQARKQLDGYNKCRNDLINGKPQDAAREAQNAIKQYQRATLARLCLATAYADSTMHYPPDSVLAVTDEILKIDPANSFALRIAIGAYLKKGDQADEISAMEKLYQLEPQNLTLAGQIVDALAASDPSKALPILQQLLKQSPGDPTLLSQMWKLQAKLNMFHDAIATGEQMVRADSSLADSSYFHRQIAMATTDSNWAKVAEYAAEGEKKFPKDAQLPFLGGVAQRNLKQFDQAAASFRSALAVDPSNNNAKLYLAQTYSDLGMPDSVVKIADAAIAGGGDKATWGPMLLAPVQDLLGKTKTDTANATQYYKRAFDLSMHADSVAPSPTAHFFIGVTAIQLAVDGMRRSQTAAQGKQMDEACSAAKDAQNYFTQAQLHMPQGGQVDAATAGAVMNAVTQYAPNADKMVKAYCKK